MTLPSSRISGRKSPAETALGCCASKEKNGAGSCQIMDYFEES
jgi:hypothetical protein